MSSGNDASTQAQKRAAAEGRAQGLDIGWTVFSYLLAGMAAYGAIVTALSVTGALTAGVPLLSRTTRDGQKRRDEILPYHLAIGNDWKVHHLSTDMVNQPWMQREEAALAPSR